MELAVSTLWASDAWLSHLGKALVVAPLPFEDGPTGVVESSLSVSEALDKTAGVLIAQETLRLLHLPQDPYVGALSFLPGRRQPNDSIHPFFWAR